MYAAVLAYFSVALLIALALLALAGAVVPRRTEQPHRRPFEGGAPPAVHAWHRVHPRWLYIPLVFLLFDMEIVFMYPWAVVFVEQSWLALSGMGMFLAILLIGVAYGAREGIFQWE